jgi:hypothetical protein
MQLSGIIGVGSGVRSTTEIFCIRQILEKKWEYNETVHQIAVDFEKPMIQLGGKYCTIFS